MAMITVAVLVFSIVAASSGEKHWALLVAGSNTYSNYRHQADVCHAYQIVRAHGIPDERIVVMMYDDIASNPENPFPGNIINRPDGPNVYPGVLKDYTGQDVQPEVFLKVLTGDAEGVKKVLGRNGKVINSGPDDRVFVNFVDHGAAGILAFPTSYLYADDLNKAIKQMYQQKRYKQLVFYIEACESGSMFSGLLEPDINVYAITAALPNESSYACYFDESRQAYLGDEYSVNWMEDSDKENLGRETLDEQYEIAKKETVDSHVQEYGDLKLGRLVVGDFQGNLTSRPLNFFPSAKRRPSDDAVPSEDVAMHILKRKVQKVSGDEGIKHHSALQDLIKRKLQTEEFFRDIVGAVSGYHMYISFLEAPVNFSDFACYKESLRLLEEMCPGLGMFQNDYVLRKVRVLANMCESDIPQEKIWAAIGKVSFESSVCATTSK